MISAQIENGTIYLSQNDPFLSPIIESAGPCTLKPRKQYFYSLIRAIIGQQLSGLAAESIIKKFFLYYGNKPDPDSVLGTPDEVLRSLGLSYQKIKYVKDLSRRISLGDIDLKKLSSQPDGRIIEELVRVKGIGIWTVQMFLIFTLNRLDVLPLNDLGIRKGVMKVYNLRTVPGEKKILNLSKRYQWSPYCSIASWYLWKSLEL